MWRWSRLWPLPPPLPFVVVVSSARLPPLPPWFFSPSLKLPGAAASSSPLHAFSLCRRRGSSTLPLSSPPLLPAFFLCHRRSFFLPFAVVVSSARLLPLPPPFVSPPFAPAVSSALSTSSLCRRRLFCPPPPLVAAVFCPRLFPLPSRFVYSPFVAIVPSPRPLMVIFAPSSSPVGCPLFPFHQRRCAKLSASTARGAAAGASRSCGSRRRWRCASTGPPPCTGPRAATPRPQRRCCWPAPAAAAGTQHAVPRASLPRHLATVALRWCGAGNREPPS